MTRSWLRFCLPALLLSGFSLTGISGCGGGGGKNAPPASGAGRVVFTLRWPDRSRLIPVAAESVRVTLRRDNVPIGEKVLMRPPTGGDAAVSFDNVLTGGDVRAEAAAYPNPDGTGVAQARASVAVTVTAGKTVTIPLSLDSTVARIVVSPDAEVVLGPGRGAEVLAEARDAAGGVVLTRPETWHWASDAPAVVSVAASGSRATLMGIARGAARVSVTETESGQTATLPAAVPLGRYDVADLGVPAGYERVEARDIGENGQVVGVAFGFNDPRAFVFQNGAFTLLETPTGTNGRSYSQANAVNRAGQVAGSAVTPDERNSPEATVWQNGVRTGLGQLTPPPPPGSLRAFRITIATALNDRGQVAGTSFSGSYASIRQAFLWTPGATDGVAHNPQMKPLDPASEAVALNNSGQVLLRPAALWQNGAITQIGDFDPADLNDAGMVAGTASITLPPDVNNNRQFTKHAVLWQGDLGQTRDLGTLFGPTDFSHARGLNGQGWVVGYSARRDPRGLNAETDQRAFVWLDGRMIELNALIPADSGWALQFAYAVNDAGQIVGSGLRNGERRAFLLTPR